MSAEYTDVRLNLSSVECVTESLLEIQNELNQTIEAVNHYLRELIKCGYYNRVSITFRCQIYESIIFYHAVIQDIEKILIELKQGCITEHEIEALESIMKTAQTLNTALRFEWKTDSYPDDFEQQRFLDLAKVYRECSEMYETLENLIEE